MIKLSISKSFFHILLEQIKNNFKDKYISKIIFYNKSDFFLSFNKDNKLFISLNNNEPFFTHTNINLSISSIVTPFSLTLKSEITEMKVVEMELLNNDRILSISLLGRNELYQDKKRNLIIELFTNHPNALLLDENKQILSAYHYSDLQSKRVLMKGFKYEVPKVLYNSTIESSFNKREIDSVYHIHDIDGRSVEDICLSILSNKKLYNDDSHYVTVPLSVKYVKVTPQDIFTNYINEAYYKRINDKYLELLHFVKNEITQTTKRINQLENDYRKNKEKLKYREIGDLILTYQYPLGLDNETKVTIDGYTFEIDRTISITQNAKDYYEKYKKAKKAIQIIDELLNKYKEDLLYFETIREQITRSSEDEILEIIDELKKENYLKEKKQKVQNKKSNHSSPHFINYRGVKIGYGRNNTQNDELTHRRANKNDWFFHVVDHPGSHVVVFKEKLDDEVLLFASQLAMYISKVEIGDVSYTQVKNIKKLSKPGLVSLTQYKTIHIKSIPDLSAYLK